MKIKNNMFAVAITIFSLVSCQAQNTIKTVPDSIATIQGKWFTYNINYQVVESVLNDNMWIATTKDYNNESSTPQVDTSYIKKLEGKHYLISRLGWKRKTVAKFELANNGSVLNVTPVVQGEDEAILLKTYKNETEKPWNALQTMQLLNAARFEQLKNAPGMDEMTREDMIKSFEARKEISPMIIEYMKANPDAGRYRIQRMVNDYRNKVMIKMGYNPFKMLKGNPYKRFENDTEIMKLLNEPMSWEN
ncbi:hypothetical protein ABN763_18110 [Spongiivirga sp. MCCC 1A20706]|uniref:hypothetical protein n=1 Tax=Spongiivirga sp. MCCC 1A20706 TaxID=3160963 RepID=UPI003977A491